MAKRKGKRPSYKTAPRSEQPRMEADPNRYRDKYPVWRFRSFDWDGPWGLGACQTTNWRLHIEKHLSDFETMTWSEIESASGGKREGRGTNNHPIERGKFSKLARDRLDSLGILPDTLFSLRCTNCVRIYGVREGTCLRIIWFDPYHCERNGSAAYGWK